MARDVRDLVKCPPEGVRLVLDSETGMPGSLSEILVSLKLLFCNHLIIFLICFFAAVFPGALINVPPKEPSVPAKAVPANTNTIIDEL